MSKYQSYSDPKVQLAIAVLAANMRQNMVSMTETYTLETSVAIMATAFGSAAGELKAWLDQHAKECEGCAKMDSNFYSIAVKNFGAAYGEVKAQEEADYAARESHAQSEVDALMQRIARKHE